MTTSPDGAVIPVEDRFAEIESRYGVDSVVGRFIRRARPELVAAAKRVEARLTPRTLRSVAPP
jgi:hypothetical protein